MGKPLGKLLVEQVHGGALAAPVHTRVHKAVHGHRRKLQRTELGIATTQQRHGCIQGQTGRICPIGGLDTHPVIHAGRTAVRISSDQSGLR
jgi:hypothetical protein